MPVPLASADLFPKIPKALRPSVSEAALQLCWKSLTPNGTLRFVHQSEMAQVTKPRRNPPLALLSLRDFGKSKSWIGTLWYSWMQIHNIYIYIRIYIYGPASLGTLPPPHPMVMGLYSSAPVPPSRLWLGGVGGVGGGGWWWVVVYPPPPCGVGGGGWWWVGGGGGGGGRSCICMYMNVSVPPSPLWCGWCGWWSWWWKKLYMCIWMYMNGMNVYF